MVWTGAASLAQQGFTLLQDGRPLFNTWILNMQSQYQSESFKTLLVSTNLTRQFWTGSLFSLCRVSYPISPYVRFVVAASTHFVDSVNFSQQKQIPVHSSMMETGRVYLPAIPWSPVCHDVPGEWRLWTLVQDCTGTPWKYEKNVGSVHVQRIRKVTSQRKNE